MNNMHSSGLALLLSITAVTPLLADEAEVVGARSAQAALATEQRPVPRPHHPTSPQAPRQP